MFVSGWVRHHALTFTRLCRIYFSQAFECLKLHRLQAYIRSTEPAYIRWAESFGFVKEGVLRKYGPEGVDYLMMAKVI